MKSLKKMSNYFVVEKKLDPMTMQKNHPADRPSKGTSLGKTCVCAILSLPSPYQ